jgi:chromosome segregation ATPase
MKNKTKFLICSIILLTSHLPNSLALFEDKEKIALQEQVKKLKGDYEVVRKDRDNILKQVKNFQQDKESLTKKIEELKGSGSQSDVELQSLKKENEILKGEVEKLKASRTKDIELHGEEKKALEQKIADLEARANSLANTMAEYTPIKIQSLIEDRNRLENETKTMAQRVLENEKQMEEMRRQLKPLELDRAELQRVAGENKDLQLRLKYISELEDRQKILLRENADYREKLEVMKAKFKEAAPGLAKAGRISQKMMRENADMHYNLGTIFLQNKQFEPAIKEYENVLELRPNDPETHYNLGVLYDDYMKDREKALYHYQKYIAINPKAPDAKRVETYILNLELEQKVR